MRRNDGQRDSQRAQFQDFLVERDALTALEGRSGFRPNLRPTRYSVFFVEGRSLRLKPPEDTQTVLERLWGRILAESVEPLVSAVSSEELRERLPSALVSFAKRASAMSVVLDDLVPEGPPPSLQGAQDALESDVVKAVALILGDEASLEAEFSLGTFERAIKLAKRLPTTEQPSNALRDRELQERFSAYVQINRLMAISLAVAPTTKHTNVGVEVCLEMLRGTALAAYSSVREATTLRAAPSEPVDPLPWDDDDNELANAG